MYEIIICPLKKLYQIVLDGDFSKSALIAVSSYEIRKDKLTPLNKALFMNFADITNKTNPDAFSQATAERIAEYLKSIQNDIDTLFICCDSGESRSTAMAAAIMRYNNTDEMQIWKNPEYHPNPLVYKLLCKALGIETTDEEIKSLTDINETAFRDSISNNKRDVR